MEKLVYLPSPSKSDVSLVDPMKFFRSAENMQRVLTDISTFSDLESMNTAPMSEWILRSCRPQSSAGERTE